MESRIKAFLGLAVDKKILPTLTIPTPNIYPCITFHLYNESGELFGQGKATEEKASCQIDIWYKVKTVAILDEISQLKQSIIDEQYFSYPTKNTDYETTTKIYHTYFNFEVLENGGN